MARATGWNSALISEVEDGTYGIDLIELLELSEVIQLDINAALDLMHHMGDQ
ncbi:hypothetical protein [Allomesorhizobium camelthorni]|uniref:Helix-turn-helix transcriptional regulator n=1 Tax=Allomesorhizobium camelthorni TaxID=475069 RepID=A0A6G4WKE7_9HYPH|nr:hypothetical protein [Mesorhizobium camelthorni]NGO54557.1 hypothetical protein [Mesorhizobium camelthorni]